MVNQEEPGKEPGFEIEETKARPTKSRINKKIIIAAVIIVIGVVLIFFFPLEIEFGPGIEPQVNESVLLELQKNVENCTGECYYMNCLSFVKDNITLCYKEGVEDDECLYYYYLGKAMKTNNVSWCYRIPFTERSIFCEFLLTNNIPSNRTENLSSDYYSLFSVFFSAVFNNNVTYCNRIEKSELKTECINAFYFLKAYRNKNTSLCDKVNLTYYFCHAFLTRDAKYCIRYSEHYYNCYDKHYIRLAFITNNSAYCNEVYNPVNKEKCLTVFNLNGVECLNLSEPYLDHFYKCLANFNNNPSICEYIRYPEYKNYCYYDIALTWNNLDVCENIQNSSIKSICLQGSQM